MATIVSSEAEMNFADLLDRVEKGESITITRRGQPVALLTPIAVSSSATKRDRRDVIRDLLEFGRGRELEGDTLAGLIQEGRRF
jgi:prevent-host-death family protein